jgi:hypothetical protein
MASRQAKKAITATKPALQKREDATKRRQRVQEFFSKGVTEQQKRVGNFLKNREKAREIKKREIKPVPMKKTNPKVAAPSKTAPKVIAPVTKVAAKKKLTAPKPFSFYTEKRAKTVPGPKLDFTMPERKVAKVSAHMVGAICTHLKCFVATCPGDHWTTTCFPFR